MTEIALHEYLELPNMTQQLLAEAVGCHQTAISRMLRVKRPMFVVTNPDGSIELIERKFRKKTA